MLRFALICSSLALLACSSPSIRGADVAEPGQEPPGRLIASYRGTDCKDGQGAAFARSSRIYLVDVRGGARVLVESVAGRDSLVVHDRFVEGKETVYQTVLDDGDGHRLIHDYRIPTDGHGDGWMALAASFRETGEESAPLHARLGAPALTCRLIADPAEPETDAGAAEP